VGYHCEQDEQASDVVVRYNYVTPTSYLELLGLFSNLIGKKKMELVVGKKRLKTGLDKVSVTVPIFFMITVL
jgi:dynein heavy chain